MRGRFTSRIARATRPFLRRLARHRGVTDDPGGTVDAEAYRAVADSGWFDPAFYTSRNPGSERDGGDPLAHFLSTGGFEGRDPHPDFESAFYLATNPDVAEARMNPLLHFVRHGQREGRPPHSGWSFGAADGSYIPPRWLLPGFRPLTVRVATDTIEAPRLNVLVPGLRPEHLSGGPNTALMLAGRLAAAGLPVRLVTTEVAPDADTTGLWAHLEQLLGSSIPPGLTLADAHDRAVPLVIGADDTFLATAWWTAQQIKYVTRVTRMARFIYLIQDYEPLLHAASSAQALAAETYDLDYLPVVNSSWLHEFLVNRRVGRFADPGLAADALVFEPAVDRTVFHPRVAEVVDGRRRLLVYARPTGGLRNLFELAVAGLQKAIHDGTLHADTWEFLGIGERFAPVPLGGGAVLRPSPWVDLGGYAQLLRDSDILVSLMRSPHPSYPPLEMAASGGLAVTTTYENKSRERLASVSANIVAADTTIEGVADALARACARVPLWTCRLEAARLQLPGTWDESFADVVPQLAGRLRGWWRAPRRHDSGQ